MKGIEELVFGIKAGYSYFYCESQEVVKTVKDIETGLDEYFSKNTNGIPYKTKLWDFETTNALGESQLSDPDDALKQLEDVKDATDSVPVGTILIAKNLNWFLRDAQGGFSKDKTSWLLNRAAKFSSPDYRKVLIIVGNVSFDEAIPDILRRDFGRVEFNLPDEKEINSIYDFIVDSVKGPKFKEPDKATRKRIVGGVRGLTRSEIIKVFSFSIVKNKGVFDPKTVEELRSAEVNSTPGLSIKQYDKKLDDLIGFDIAKEIIGEWIDDPKAKGVIILGTAGVGKTHLAQAIAGHYNRLAIEIEFAQLMGDGLVGQAEKAMKRALDVIAANANPAAPIIVFIDEIEKGLAGTSGAGGVGGANDGGTTDRSNAQFLKFLSDARPEGIYIIATCNDIEKLPAAYVRAERWDTAPIFVDLPDKAQRAEILAHYQKVYGVKEGPKDMAGWSGAEIKTWCKLARKKLDKGKKASEADELIVPVSKTMEKEIDYLRRWKEGKTVPATRKVVAGEAKAARRIDY